MMEYILGVDLGTSGVKARLVDLATLKLDCMSIRTYAEASENIERIVTG